MLSHEWRELEVLCERISDLRHRYSHAQRTKNVGLLDGLKNDITMASRQRELLVRHISARLGTVAAARTHGMRAQAGSGDAESEAGVASEPDDTKSAMLYGFQHDE
jgi:hypothetical protein